MSLKWNPLVDKLTPYQPGEQPKQESPIHTKLNTNENPYPPSSQAINAMQSAINADLRLYPDPESSDLKQVIAQRLHLDASYVFIGNGSDEVLAHIFQGFFQPDKPILFPSISYSFYPVYAKLYQLSTQVIELENDFTFNVDDFFMDNGGIIFPNPNAPTGQYIALSEIERLLQHNTQSIVVIDEAYIDFGGQSATSLVSDYDNLVVTQTLSKSRSLAGLRLGFAIANPNLIHILNAIKNSFNSYPIDRVASAGAIAAIKDEAYFNLICQKVVDNRQWIEIELALLGFTLIPSKANFVLVKPPINAKTLFEQLKSEGILVRYFDTPRLRDFLRVTIGSMSECKKLIAALTLLAK